MNWWQSIILGISQGITEWLPISSDGHLVLLEKIMAVQVNIAFDIFLHLGSLLVIIIFFREQLKSFIKDFFKKPSAWPQDRKKWWQYFLISTLLTGIIGLSIYPFIENLRTLEMAAYGFLVTSLFVGLSFWSKEKREFSYKIAILIGIVQGLAVLPGVSRSGLSLSVALLYGLKRQAAFDYVFILAIPAIIASFILSVKDLAWQPVYLLGFFTTIIVGLLALNLLKKIVQNNKFYQFCFYTLVLGLVILVLN
jgi:undecaprenyl-diphosphatase